jgi:enoyl-CoA hydratase/carnithine racemase
LTLNAPRRLNALGTPMLRALDAALDGLPQDTRVLVIAGGARAFSAGHDLSELDSHRADTDGGAARDRALFALCTGVMQRLASLPLPTIAAVRGVATAAGCQLAASCDLVLAADTARFGVNGIDVGLFCSTPMVALTRKIAPSAALEYLLTGDLMPAARAADLGLVTRIYPDEELDAAAWALARRIAAKSPAALRHGLPAFRAIRGQDLATAYRIGTEAILANLAEPETAEGIRAFLSRRKPGADAGS